MKLEDFLVKNYSYNPNVKNDIKTYLEQWKSWYQGNVRNFHNYFVYNGNKKNKQHRYSMNMAKQISEDWSDILWSEKCKISLKNEESQKNFENIIDKLDLYNVINQSIEKSGALGTCANVLSVYDIIENETTTVLDVSDAKIRLDIVNVDWIFPLSWNNREITECAFGSVEYKDSKKYVVLSVHKLNEQGNYVIYNHLFVETNGNLTEITEQDNTVQTFDTKSKTKWFIVYKPNLTNNLFENNPFGIPHYANAIDSLKAVDISFDALKNEIKDGRKRTFVRADMFNYDNGTQRMVFDPEDINIYQLPSGATKDDLIQSDTEDLRVDSQVNALNTNLNILGNQCGFGENHYHFDGTNLSTATAVISSNSKLFRRKKKLEIGYESSIFDLTEAICYISNTFTGEQNINYEEIAVLFDDSIIEDKESESNRAMREVSAGLLSKAEYREKIFGETPEIATKKIQEIQEQDPSVEELVGKDKKQDEEE